MAFIKKRGKKGIYHLIDRSLTPEYTRSLKTSDKRIAVAALTQYELVSKGLRDIESAVRAVMDVATAIAGGKANDKSYHIGDLWKLYQEHEGSPPADSTLNERRKKLNNFSKWAMKQGVELISQVKEIHADSYMKSVKDAAVSTRKQYRSDLQRAFKVLRVPLGLISDPFAHIQTVRGSGKSGKAAKIKELKPKQAMAMIKEAIRRDKAGENKFPGFWPLALAIGFYTGLRREDLVELEFSELDLSFANNPWIRLDPNKGQRHDRQVNFPMHSEYAAQLLKTVEKADRRNKYIWPKVVHECKHNTGRNLDREFIEMLYAIGLTDKDIYVKGKRVKKQRVIKFYSLRHAMATTAIDEGADIKDVSTVAGHGAVAMTQNYNHSQAAGKRVAEIMPSLGIEWE